jgi:hypothetical protein
MRRKSGKTTEACTTSKHATFRIGKPEEIVNRIIEEILRSLPINAGFAGSCGQLSALRLFCPALMS